MKLYDMHLHSFNHTPAPETLLAEMEKGGGHETVLQTSVNSDPSGCS